MKTRLRPRLNVLNSQVHILDASKRPLSPILGLPKQTRPGRLSKKWLETVNLHSLAMLASSGAGDCCENPYGGIGYTVVNDYETPYASLPGGFAAWCGVAIDVSKGVDKSSIFVKVTFGVWTTTDTSSPIDVRYWTGGFKSLAGYYICWNRIGETDHDTQICPFFYDGQAGNQFQTADLDDPWFDRNGFLNFTCEVWATAYGQNATTSSNAYMLV